MEALKNKEVQEQFHGYYYDVKNPQQSHDQPNLDYPVADPNSPQIQEVLKTDPKGNLKSKEGSQNLGA